MKETSKQIKHEQLWIVSAEGSIDPYKSPGNWSGQIGKAINSGLILINLNTLFASHNSLFFSQNSHKSYSTGEHKIQTFYTQYWNCLNKMVDVCTLCWMRNSLGWWLIVQLSGESIYFFSFIYLFPSFVLSFLLSFLFSLLFSFYSILISFELTAGRNI